MPFMSRAARFLFHPAAQGSSPFNFGEVQIINYSRDRCSGSHCARTSDSEPGQTVFLVTLEILENKLFRRRVLSFDLVTSYTLIV